MTEPTPAPVTACLVIIGNEILSGRTQDINLNYLAKGLNEVGVQMREARVIPDVPETIVATVNEVRAKYDYVFTTGGIGPTHDDITAECIAAAFGVKLILHPEAKRRLEAHYLTRGIELNEARLRMAHVPEGATLIDNPVSTAPGFRIGNVHVMAGVPKIMQAMFDGIRHGLKGGAKMLSRSVTCGLAEGTVARDLGLIQADYPAVEIGSYPFWTGGGGFGVSLVLRSADPAALEHASEAVIAMIRGFGGEPVEREPETKA
ncbi:MAG TPA: competence/damage-inducible protein A [Aliidongia sp.]|uniref:competence/damage-inducible protein A n=1 Tax=Aliidongia sp. TaxID=1914230 RepID=UPI002DDC9C37|nr:competence/damage-inducible protein A [Aliidongia sp.]HEV2672992.1 competence/damage-inducible protein A [Aliidongia sp.]